MAIDHEAIAHVLRATSDLTGRKSFVLIGSAAVVAAYGAKYPTNSMMSTVDVDLYAIDTDDIEQFSDDVEAIGFGSQFHDTYSYYADGVSPQTANMPIDWSSRAKVYDVPGADGSLLLFPM